VPDCRHLVVMAMRSGLYLPLFDELADPAVVARSPVHEPRLLVILCP
jgi:hypothetical protein